MRRLRCANCGGEIPHNQQMVIKKDGELVPVHYDCRYPYESAPSFEERLRNARRDMKEKQNGKK